MRNVVGKKLQRNGSSKTSILGLVNDAHPSACYDFEDGVVTNAASGI